MSKYYEIDAQSKFRVHKVSNQETHTHEGVSDKARLIYSEINERLYMGSSTDWLLVSTPHDIFDQNTKVLMGQWPLPVNWNLDITHDDISVLACTSSVGVTGGSWTISDINESGSHKHGMGNSTTTLLIGKSDLYDIVAPWKHTHGMDTDGNHFHDHDGNWRPYHIKYCVAEYS